MESSGDANRHLNPQWNYIPRGVKLYPTILYLFGVKDRKAGGSGVNPDEHKHEYEEGKESISSTQNDSNNDVSDNNNDTNDDFKDKIFNLMTDFWVKGKSSLL